MAVAWVRIPLSMNPEKSFSGAGLVKRSRATIGCGARLRHDVGAAAVEFALVMPVLFLLVFGIIDYGLWFNDSLNVRQGVREAARQGVVSTSVSCSSGSTSMEKLRCRTVEEIGAVTGPTYVKIAFPDGWVRGRPLVVCGMVRADALVGFVPLPSDRLIKSKTELSIEVTTPSPPVTGIEDALPSGGSWSWCT